MKVRRVVSLVGASLDRIRQRSLKEELEYMLTIMEVEIECNKFIRGKMANMLSCVKERKEQCCDVENVLQELRLSFDQLEASVTAAERMSKILQSGESNE